MRLFNKFTVVLMLLISSVLSASAQHFTVPSDYSFDNKDSYKKYEKQIKKCISWLETTDPAIDGAELKRASRFFTEWVTGCDYIHFTQDVRINAFIGDSPDYRIYYMAGWVAYELEHKGEKLNRVEATTAGLEKMLKVYKKHPPKKKDVNMEELMTKQDAGTLKKWVSDRIS